MRIPALRMGTVSQKSLEITSPSTDEDTGKSKGYDYLDWAVSKLPPHRLMRILQKEDMFVGEYIVSKLPPHRLMRIPWRGHKKISFLQRVSKLPPHRLMRIHLPYRHLHRTSLMLIYLTVPSYRTLQKSSQTSLTLLVK